jgi:HAD superfamily hydrolase (TIGR01549 family)
MFKDIIWDFDGTLFDTYPAMVHSFKKALADSGVNAKEAEILSYMKISMTEAINYYNKLYKLKENFREAYSAYNKEEDSVSRMLPFPKAKEVCKYISEHGGRNFILTHRGESTLNLLKRYSMDIYFTDAITKSHGFKRKPDPEGYNHLIGKYNMSKDSVLIVGDREIEIIAARKVGVKVCLFNTNKVSIAELPDFEINSMEELSHILGLEGSSKA